jgi:FMN-dependent oxidoreductase (nitrilotriacetate monooxygenase family)
MRSARMLKLGFALHGVGPSWRYWRHPEAVVDPCVNIDFYKEQARLAEEGRLDFLFVADSLIVTAESSPHYLNSFEPVTLMSALAAVTSRIGLVSTISVSFSEPYTIARQLASLDRISGGRAGWNLVTSWIEESALNFSKEKLLEHDLRYELAEEYLEVTKGLWDSWEDDALIRDKASGRLFDPNKLHLLEHKGRFFSVKGPLNIARSPQGRPVIFQAGVSNAGRTFAARHADAVFVGAVTYEEAKEYYVDVKARASQDGRAPEHLVLMPPICPIVGRTEADVQRKLQWIDELMPIDKALAALGRTFRGVDFSKLALDQTLTNVVSAIEGGRRGELEKLRQMILDERLTLRQIALRFSRVDLTFAGTPEKVANTIEHWFTTGAADGFIFYELLPGDLRDFVKLVVPLLQERGIFRKEYEARTFRGNLGVPCPVNRYAQPVLSALPPA